MAWAKSESLLTTTAVTQQTATLERVQQLRGVSLVMDGWGHTHSTDEAGGVSGSVVADQHVQPAGGVSFESVDVLLGDHFRWPAPWRGAGLPFVG